MYFTSKKLLSFIGCLALASTTHAAVLTGSGPFLPLPSPNPAWPVGVSPTYTTVGTTHTGTWSPLDVHPDWAGTFGMSTPPIPALSTGSTNYDFTSLPLGYLPAGTFFYFGDVDGGSTNPERYDLAALNGGGGILANEWLDDTYAVTGSGTGGGGTILANDLPSWDWNISNPNQYQIAASLAPSGNPAVGAVLRTNQPIWGLRLNKPETHYGFNILAPPLGSDPTVPEPTTAILLGLGLTAGVLERRNAR